MAKNVQIPQKGLVFDHVFNKENNGFVSWESTMQRHTIPDDIQVTYHVVKNFLGCHGNGRNITHTSSVVSV